MRFTTTHQLNQLPIGAKIQFITDRAMDCGTVHLASGTTVTLTKVTNAKSKKPIWVDKFMKWSIKWIPSQFQVVR